MFPLPFSRMSSFLNIRTSRYPNGIDPKRYAIAIDKIQAFIGSACLLSVRSKVYQAHTGSGFGVRGSGFHGVWGIGSVAKRNPL
jgi:hypothetical protein